MRARGIKGLAHEHTAPTCPKCHLNKDLGDSNTWGLSQYLVLIWPPDHPRLNSLCN